MTGWGADELTAIGGAKEVLIAPDRRDGTPGRATTIWVVRAGNDLYVPSYRGALGAWYRRAIGGRHGTIRAGRLERRVWFDDVEADQQAQIDEAYQTKYGSYGPSYVRPMVGPAAVATTLRLRPAD
jgi:hypothetical protein